MQGIQEVERTERNDSGALDMDKGGGGMETEQFFFFCYIIINICTWNLGF